VTTSTAHDGHATGTGSKGTNGHGFQGHERARHARGAVASSSESFARASATTMTPTAIPIRGSALTVESQMFDAE